jgi:hypothetical protein
MNFSTLFRAVDTMIAFRDAAKRLRGGPGAGNAHASSESTALSQSAAAQGIAGQIETRLTNVVVAALKEAFDRDHARLELERVQLEEERRRAEEALRLEIRRQAVERELTRLRLLAATALIGWIASVVVLGVHANAASTPVRVALGAGWLLLLAALAAAFTAQGRINIGVSDRKEPVASDAAPLWLLIAGLAVTAMSLLL